MAPFLIMGNCELDPVTRRNFCEEFAKTAGRFDTATGTITVSVPLAAIKAKQGSKIKGLAVFAATALFFNVGFADDLLVTRTFVVPKR